MTDRKIAGSQSSVCPSCNTRLRLPPQNAAESWSECPECNTSLAIRRNRDNSVSVSIFESAADTSLPQQPVRSQSVRWWVANSQYIAAAVATAGGIVIATMLMSSSGEPQHPSSLDGVHVQKADPPPDRFADSRIQSDATNTETPLSGSQTVTASIRPELGTFTENEQRSSVSSPEVEAESEADAVVASLSELPVQLSLPPDSKSNIETIGGTIDRDSKTKAVVIPATDTRPQTRKMSFPERLEISIRSFRQSKSVPLSEVIRTVEQMCRVKVDTSAASSEQLSQQLSISLQDTTPVLILTEAARKSGLRVIVGKDSVRMVSGQD